MYAGRPGVACHVQRDRAGWTWLSRTNGQLFWTQPVLRSVELSRYSDGTGGGKGHAMHVKKVITVRRSPEEVYRYWRDFGNLPRFMNNLESVRVLDQRRSRWKAQAPAGKTVEWDAEIVEDRPNELIAWRSIEGADIENSGEVRFRAAPREQGTEIEVKLSYEAPAGKVGRVVAKLFGKEPAQQVRGDLRRFKQVLETGEVVRSDASLESTHLAKQRPAQPPEAARQVATAPR